MGFRRVSNIILAAAAMASLAATAPAGAQEPLDIGGRWKEIRSSANEDFRIGTIEFIPCGERMCGLRIDARGGCGAKFIEVFTSESKTMAGSTRAHYAGSSTWRGRLLEFYTWRQSDGGIRLYASEGRSPFSRVPLPVFESTFEAAGEARCKAPTS